MTIPNFRQVNSWLYRGGQPDTAGFAELKRIGVKTIISLRWSSELRARQRNHALSLGFNYISIPLSYCIFPTSSQIEKFFSIINNTEDYPIFVHCKHGSDRTGMMMAFYRMTNEGWSVQDAYGEMEKLGFHKLFVYHYKYAVFRYGRQIKQSLRKNQND